MEEKGSKPLSNNYNRFHIFLWTIDVDPQVVALPLSCLFFSPPNSAVHSKNSSYFILFF